MEMVVSPDRSTIEPHDMGDRNRGIEPVDQARAGIKDTSGETQADEVNNSCNERTRAYIKKKWAFNSDILALLFLVLVLWTIAYCLFEEAVNEESQIFSLAVLFISAKVAGVLFGLVKIPPLVGMLLMGVLLRNVGFLNITGNYRTFTAILRQLALVNILLPAGLGLDPAALKKLFLMILGLATIPVAAEVAGVMVISRYLLDLPFLWGLLLGLLLAAVSPAVIIPCLFELQELGYGVNKGIHTLVIAASTINDIICIALFGIVIGVIFSTGSLLMQILEGPIAIAIGLAYGVLWGLVCSYIPSTTVKYLVTLRTLLLGFGCVLSAIGSQAIGYGGAGALGCIIAAFVASIKWRKNGWDNSNPVRMNFVLLWKFFEPISFSLIGMEVDFSILEGNIVLWGTIAMIVSLILRMLVSFGLTQCSNLNLKENVFVALSWVPKATVQAALGPVALDIARTLGDEELISYANIVIIVAVISIIITSPLGAIIIMQLGPRFLHRTVQRGPAESSNAIENINADSDIKSQVLHTEQNNSDLDDGIDTEEDPFADNSDNDPEYVAETSDFSSEDKNYTYLNSQNQETASIHNDNNVETVVDTEIEKDVSKSRKRIQINEGKIPKTSLSPLEKDCRRS